MLMKMTRTKTEKNGVYKKSYVFCEVIFLWFKKKKKKCFGKKIHLFYVPF